MPEPQTAPDAPAAIVWRYSWSAIAVVALVGLASLVPFWNGIEQMWGWWIESPEYSHALLIPPISAFLIWQQRDRLEQLPFEGSWLGVAIVCCGGLLLALGQIGTLFVLVQYAFVVVLFGLALALVGLRGFRRMLVPLLMLLFMVPLPQFVLANLSTRLQLLSSSLGVGFMRWFDVSVLLEGNVIDLGNYQLQVAEACSGLRYLFPLMTLGFLMAYFYKGAWWKRGLVFLSSIPLTVLMNSFRVGTIGIMVDRWGIAMAQGFLHEFQGWALFMLSALLMLGEIALLNRITPEPGTWRHLFGVEFPAPTPPGAAVRHRRLSLPFAASSALVIAFGIASLIAPRPREIHPSRQASFAEYPMRIGQWRGERQSLSGVYSATLQLDDYLLANYFSPSGAVVNVYMAYYQAQHTGDAVHSPHSCLPGGGWQMREFGQRTLSGVLDEGAPLRVNRTLIELGEQRELVYYWFQQRGRVLTNEFAVKWFIFWDALTRHRTDGALIRLTTAVPPAGGVEAADRRLTELAARIAPTLHRYVPD